jgi:hypothetical protein
MTTVKGISAPGQAPSCPPPPHPERNLASQRRTARDGAIAAGAIREASFDQHRGSIGPDTQGNVNLRDIYNWWTERKPSPVSYEQFKRSFYENHQKLNSNSQSNWLQKIFVPDGQPGDNLIHHAMWRNDTVKYHPDLRIYIPPDMRRH